MLRYEIVKHKYVEMFEDMLLVKYGYDAEEVWLYYHQNIFPFLSLISKEMNSETPPTQEQVRYSLYVSNDMWLACKKTFVGLRRALQGKSASMKLKAQIDLQREVFNNPNAKYIEMQSKRYDDEFTKSDDNVVELPKTLNVTVSNSKLSDKEIEDKINSEE